MTEQRQRVVEEARSWLGTPYHHLGDVKGAGVDCAMLLVRVYCDLGLAPTFDPRPYSRQWYVHQDEPVYLNWIAKYARKVEQPSSGDIALFNFGRHAAHGAIVIDDDYMIHAYGPSRCVELTEIRTFADPRRRRGTLHSYWSPFS